MYGKKKLRDEFLLNSDLSWLNEDVKFQIKYLSENHLHTNDQMCSFVWDLILLKYVTVQ